MYQFYVVGKKASDCYVLQDVRNGMGGKACASLYTIRQLIDAGYAVCGIVDDKGIRLSNKNVVIVNLKGEPIHTAKDYPDIPSTKRSCSTFINGIKKPKMVKKTSEISDVEKIPKPPKSDLVWFYNEYLSDGNVNKRMTAKKAVRIYNYGLPEDKKVTEFITLYDEKGKMMPVYYNIQKDISITKVALSKKYDDIIKSLNLTADKYVKYNIMGHSTPKEIVLYLLATTRKPIKYTYGLKYRRPSTYEVPISVASAIEKFKHGMTDVTEHKDYIDVNTFSENDMW